MADFATWLAKMIAGAGALLAAVWLWQAMPLDGPQTERAVAECLRSAGHIGPNMLDRRLWQADAQFAAACRASRPRA